MIVFCGVWGMWWWRLTTWDANATSMQTGICRLPTFEEWKRARQDTSLLDLRQAHIDRGIPNHLPLDMLMRGTAPAAMGASIALHQWNGPVPIGSICLAANIYVCSPEFCYFQICADVRRIVPEQVDEQQCVVILAELGCELCGSYSRQNTPRGFKSRQLPLTSTASLLFFESRMASAYGSRRLYEVLLWIADGLASPMETAMYLMLCLPPRLGGLGLMRPYINSRLQVPAAFAVRGRQQAVVPDFLWPEARLVAEYDSDEDHRGRQREDAERRELLQDMGYVVVAFHSDDLMDRDKFNAKASSLAAHLGCALPPASSGFVELQKRLHGMLLRHARWI